MNGAYMHPADQVVAMMNKVYYKGLTTTSGGNISMTDAQGHIWITPSGVDKGRLTRADIVEILPDGRVVGKHKPSMELPFHSMVMKTTGKRAVLHAHPPALVAVSLLHQAPDTEVLCLYASFVKKLGLSVYDLPGSIRLGEKINRVFETGCDAVMMENHGIVVNADTLEQAFIKFECLEHAAQLTMEAAELGEAKHVTSVQKETFAERMRCVLPLASLGRILTPSEADLCNELAAFSERAAKGKLFRSFDGMFAVRYGTEGFFVTPEDRDRESLRAEDAVGIFKGESERGKTPSRYADLAGWVFENKPAIGAVAVAAPVHAMAFGVTGAELDSRTIPESYLMMRCVARFSLDQLLDSPRRVLNALSPSCPVVMVDNGFVLAGGANLTKCFDSLEVTEVTAKTLINAAKLHKRGEIKKITPEQVKEINEAFGIS